MHRTAPVRVRTRETSQSRALSVVLSQRSHAHGGVVHAIVVPFHLLDLVSHLPLVGVVSGLDSLAHHFAKV